MAFMTLILAAALAQATPPLPAPPQTGRSPVATPEDSGAIRIHVGDTGIRCVKLPCPSRGVFVPDPQKGGVSADFLLTDRDGSGPPPPMIGRDADLAAVGKAWDERACLAIDGRLISGKEDRPVLRVDRIVGPCREQR